MLKTAEFVSPKHPDKICDRISDAILDECLIQDPNTRSAIETMAGHGTVAIMGELSTKAEIDIDKVVHRIAGPNVKIITKIEKQSDEIAQGVDIGGAGDQGVMVGYACNDNDEFVPFEYYLVRSLNKYLYGKNPQDGKTQITVNSQNEVVALVASWANTDKRELKELVYQWKEEFLIKFAKDVNILVNPAGNWSISGIDADTGLTGRKIVIDNYGPGVPVGGGAFSGKDATKVDRSAAYKARQVAIDLLKKKGAKEVLVRLAYAIGYLYPVDATALIDGKEVNLMNRKDEFQPKNIIKELELKKPIFEKTAEWGHFGRGFTWDA